MAAPTYDGKFIAGDFFLDPKDAAGNSTGLIGPLNTTRCAITHPTPEIFPRISHRVGTVGQALNTIMVGKPPEIDIAVDDAPEAILNMLFGGTSEAINEAGGSATDEPITLIKDRWVKLPDRNLSATGFNLSTVAVPATPLVKDTDYAVDFETGMLMALTTGAAVACLADYTNLAVTGTRHLAASRVSTKCEIIMKGLDMVTNKPCRMSVWEAVLYRDGAFDPATQAYVTTALKGTLNTPAGKTQPYEYEDLTLATA